MSQWFHASFAIDSQFSPSSKDNFEHFLVHLRADEPEREQSQPQEKWRMKPTTGGLPVKRVSAGISVSCQGGGLLSSHLGKKDFSPGRARQTSVLAGQEGKNMQMLQQASVVHEGWLQWGRWLLWKSAMPKELPGALLLQTVPKDVHNKYPALQRPVVSTHQSDPNQALHKPRKPTWDTFR